MALSSGITRLEQQLKTLNSYLCDYLKNCQVPALSLPELSSLFKEVGVTSEELDVAMEELVTQTEKLDKLRFQAQAERDSYRNIFQSFPYPYIVTNSEGKILDANQAAARVLNLPLDFLPNKPLSVFIAEQERQKFRYNLNQILSITTVQEYLISLQPRQGRALEMLATVTPIYDSLSETITLQWLLRNPPGHQQVFQQISNNLPSIEDNGKRYIYHKGEIISLQPQILWIVNAGLVKLTTINEKGEEVVVGLLSSSMAFGADLTTLTTYQATALSPEVELVRFKMSDLLISPELMQAFVLQITKRLQQAEALLAIAGKRKLKDRFWSFLLWLKQEFGETVPQGTRLTIRLTHQDIADACCTSRVTVTRELGKLQDLNKITIDQDNHIIFMQK